MHESTNINFGDEQFVNMSRFYKFLDNKKSTISHDDAFRIFVEDEKKKESDEIMRKIDNSEDLTSIRLPDKIKGMNQKKKNLNVDSSNELTHEYLLKTTKGVLHKPMLSKINGVEYVYHSPNTSLYFQPVQECSPFWEKYSERVGNIMSRITGISTFSSIRKTRDEVGQDSMVFSQNLNSKMENFSRIAKICYLKIYGDRTVKVVTKQILKKNKKINEYVQNKSNKMEKYFGKYKMNEKKIWVLNDVGIQEGIL